MLVNKDGAHKNPRMLVLDSVFGKAAVAVPKRLSDNHFFQAPSDV